MSKTKEPEETMRDEYEFDGGVRGKYSSRFADGTNIVVLDRKRSARGDVMAGKKKASFSKTSIEALAQDKPVVYKIRNRNGTNTYTGVAKKGRVADRLKEHLPGGPDPIPGAASVEIRQMNSIAEARDAEARSIKRSKPRHNKVGK